MEDLAGRTQCHLEDKWRKACAQFIACGESTAVEGAVQHAVFVWGIDEAFQLVQVLLELVPRKGTAVARWLRYCATNGKVAGSIPAGVIGIFIEIKSFRSHYGPGVYIASNRNEYQEHFLGVKAAVS